MDRRPGTLASPPARRAYEHDRLYPRARGEPPKVRAPPPVSPHARRAAACLHAAHAPTLRRTACACLQPHAPPPGHSDALPPPPRGPHDAPYPAFDPAQPVHAQRHARRSEYEHAPSSAPRSAAPAVAPPSHPSVVPAPAPAVAPAPRPRPSMGIASLLNSGPGPTPKRLGAADAPAPDPPPPAASHQPKPSPTPSPTTPAEPNAEPPPVELPPPGSSPTKSPVEPTPEPAAPPPPKAAQRPRLRLSRKPRNSSARSTPARPAKSEAAPAAEPAQPSEPAAEPPDPAEAIDPAQNEASAPQATPAPVPVKRSHKRRALEAEEPPPPEPEPKGRKRPRTVDEEPDLEAPENVVLWAPALGKYRSEAYLRRDAVEAAYGVLEDEADEATVRGLARAYLRRYDAAARVTEMRRQQALAAERAARLAAERRKAERRMQAEREQAARLARLAQARRQQVERQIEQEIWNTLHPPAPPPTALAKTAGKPRPSTRISHQLSEREDDDESDDEAPLASRILISADSPRVAAPTKPKARPLRSTLEEGAESPSAGASGAATPVVEAPQYDADGYVILSPARIAALEAAHRKVWSGLAKRDVPKMLRVVQMSQANRTAYWRRISQVVQREAKRAVSKQTKTAKDVQSRGRRAMREILLFWRKNEREERELRKAAEKAAAEKARQDEELREAQRQARKLNFLITQTELYSHFVGSKLKTEQSEQSADTQSASASASVPASGPASGTASGVVSTPLPSSEVPPSGGDGALEAIDFDNEDETILRAHATRNAQAAVAAAKQKAQAFDDQAASDRMAQEAAAQGDDASKQLDGLNFLHPEGMGDVTVDQPKMLTCELKEYQLKGLNWLANLYEQGINGILADEMGLGKTVQSISLMAYLAEVHDIWGPFLVISPSSTLHNWQQEITKFVPALKVLPYWGSVKDRAVLRKFFNKKHTVYTRDAPFHVLVTSYQLAVSDEKYLNRVKWQYMVLDEAQAIKSSSSARWKALLGFNCRNRLLLTGTPVQNSMQELWALLHFIMPSLFDNHDEFSEWFSRDIEANAENKGALNEHQLRRLHTILKPFMLRRVKKNVQNQLGEKVEVDLLCDMSSRQRMMYNALKERVSITELVRAGAAESDQGLKSLMNLVMQFRKVCNHPELFERADVRTPLAFAQVPRSAQALAREGDVLDLSFAARNPISFSLPKLVTDNLPEVAGWNNDNGFDTRYLDGLLNIWRQPNLVEASAISAPLRLVAGVSEVEAEAIFHAPRVSSLLASRAHEQHWDKHGILLRNKELAASSGPQPPCRVRSYLPYSGDSAWADPLLQGSDLTPLDQVSSLTASIHPFASPHRRVLVPAAVAPPVEVVASDAHLHRSLPLLDPSGPDRRSVHALYGLPPSEKDDLASLSRVRGEAEEILAPQALSGPGAAALSSGALPLLPPQGLLGSAPSWSLPSSSVQMPSMERLIHDSSKLARLDSLLRELKAGGHRVLIYFQMTRMIDLIEEYLISRQYKYLRLDGASKISDRRDMVMDWQTKCVLDPLSLP